MSYQCMIKGRKSIRVVVLVMTIFGSTLSVTYGENILFVDEPNNPTIILPENKIDSRFTLNTEGCIIPIANDISPRRYMNPVTRPSQCRNYQHHLLTHNRTHIMTASENFGFYKIINKQYLRCCYKPFYRPEASYGIPNKYVDDRIKYSKCIKFDDVVYVNDEFVNVHCSYRNKKIYNQFFVFTPKKAFTPHRNDPFYSDRTMYNIIIMGFGSLSRQNFYRSMPRMWNLLQKYEAVELKGYSTVAEDTFQNLIPVLLGMNSSELSATCWLNPNATLDSCPFIWERFKDVGYYTALAEDTARYGMFNMEKFGFRGRPTDYYIHPFIHESESVIEKHRQRNSFKLRRPYTVATCMGDRYYYEVLLNYIESLTTTLSSSKLFGLFWETSMSHNNINHPLKMDNTYVRLIQNLKSSNYLKDTILIFLSDHGMDIGNFHLTKEGLIELRQPLINILVPDSFRKEFKLAYHNLQVNKERLTTPFDIHKTLVDLLDLSDITDDEIAKRSEEPYSQDRAISLFLPIPGNRTCKMAGIEKKWCNCHNYVEVNSADFAEIRRFLTQQVNEPLKTYPQCLKLVVDEILEAYEIIAEYVKNMEWRDFRVVVRTAPGGGVFEAVLRYHRQWILVNTMKRINVNFKNNCVQDNFVKSYCYCG